MDSSVKVYLSSKNLKTEGVFNKKDNSLKVLKGSMIAKEETNSFRKHYGSAAKLRDQFISIK